MALAASILTLAALPAPSPLTTSPEGCSNVRPVACIDEAADRYGQDPVQARRVAWCESRDEPRASNGTHFGLFQFDWATWGLTPFRHRSVWSARWSSLAAMFLWARGEQQRWECW